MTVEQDAGKLLLFFYDEIYNNHNRCVETQDVMKNINWSDRRRIDTAFNYLMDNGWLLKAQNVGGNIEGVQRFRIRGLSPQGMEKVNDTNKFKATFGIELDLMILKLSLSKEI
jgi:hypothetical protein